MCAGLPAGENERRLPVRPLHLDRAGAGLRAGIFLERGCGERSGMAGSQLAPLVAGVRARPRLIAGCEVIVLPEPARRGIAELRQGQVLRGWPRCVQDYAVTQLGIGRRLTLIAWEAMSYRAAGGSFGVHVFPVSNELAGCCPVLQSLPLLGMTGAYGRRVRAAVISFGAAARGAVTALTAPGIFDVTVLTHRNVPAAASPAPSVRMAHCGPAAEDPARILALTPEGPVPVAGFLARPGIVVSCVLQDTDPALMLVTRDQLRLSAPGSLFVDVPCGQGTGSERARPPSFAEPMSAPGQAMHCYAAGHGPSCLRTSATWEISEALIPPLRTVTGGPGARDRDQAIRRAIEIRDGVIRNPRILSFQRRSAEFPHTPVQAPAATPGAGRLRPPGGRPGPSRHDARDAGRHPAHGASRQVRTAKPKTGRPAAGPDGHRHRTTGSEYEPWSRAFMPRNLRSAGKRPVTERRGPARQARFQGRRIRLIARQPGHCGGRPTPCRTGDLCAAIRIVRRPIDVQIYMMSGRCQDSSTYHASRAN